MNLYQWAIKWGVSVDAIDDLRREFGLIAKETIGNASENCNQNKVRLEASRCDNILWRNNVGAAMDNNGVLIRYGLCNDSKQINKRIKSSDLIGIKQLLITEAMVGMVVGQFLAREIKPEGWQYTGSERELAQLKYLELVVSLGGDACFATGEGTISR